MTRLIRRTLGVYLFAMFVLVATLAAAWFAIAGFFYGLVNGLARFPGLGALAATAMLAAYLAVHPDRVPNPIGRKANP